MRFKLSFIIFALSFFMMLTGCGQTGKLYLPDEAKPATTVQA